MVIFPCDLMVFHKENTKVGKCTLKENLFVILSVVKWICAI